jgi:hypothetical protein
MRSIDPTAGHRRAGGLAAASIQMAEQELRQAGRRLEHAGIADPEYARIAKVLFRLAQRVAVDSGRLEPAA